MNQHALILFYRKHDRAALARSSEASALLEQHTTSEVLPIVRGRTSMYLATLQARQAEGTPLQTLDDARSAFAHQSSSTTVIPLYADCGAAAFTLWDGAYLRTTTEARPRDALEKLHVYGQLQPQAQIPERFRLECVNARTFAAIGANDLEEALACFDAGRQGAMALGSLQRNSELATLAKQLRARWPHEPPVQQATAPTVHHPTSS
jgi:hypothetical protein